MKTERHSRNFDFLVAETLGNLFYTGDGYYDFKKWNVDFLTWKVETVNWGSNLVIIALFKPQRVLNGLI